MMTAICSFVGAVLAVIFIVMLFKKERSLNHSIKKAYLAAIICAVEFLGGHWVLGLIWIGTYIIQILECKEMEKLEKKDGDKD